MKFKIEINYTTHTVIEYIEAFDKEGALKLILNRMKNEDNICDITISEAEGLNL